MAGKVIKKSSSFPKKIGNRSDIATVSVFTKGYRNREDVTILDPHVLVKGSHNVLSNVSGRISNRKGYMLDGPESMIESPIVPLLDWTTSLGTTINLRAGFLTIAGNDGKLQFRYVDSTGTVNWVDLLMGLSSVKFNSDSYFNTATSKRRLLMVNGGNYIYNWSGGMTTIASTTANSVTTSGTKTFAQLGFDFKVSTLGDTTTTYTRSIPTPGTKRYTFSTGINPNLTPATMPVGTQITIPSGSDAGIFSVTNVQMDYFEFATVEPTVTNYTGAITYDGGYNYQFMAAGVTYTYTAGAATKTLLGISPSPATIPIGTLMFQTVVQLPNSQTIGNGTAPGIPTAFNNDLIGVLRNQAYIGSLTSSMVYISKVNDYSSYVFSTPRVVGEGAQVVLAGSATCFIPQEDEMYIGSGKDSWYLTKFTLSADLSDESFEVTPLKTTQLQGPISQKACTKIKNDIAYLSNEVIFNSLGRVDNVVLTPQITDLSFPIVNDMDAYDFTDATVLYLRQFVYIAIPKEEIVLVYNMTDPKNKYWEAPQLLPISGFYVVDGKLYGHSAVLSESYKLFTGYADRATTVANGNPIYSVVYFAFDNQGIRSASKSFNKFYIEGYMTTNTTLNVGLQYDLDGCSTSQSFPLKGTSSFVCYGSASNSLGKNPLGAQPFGGEMPFLTTSVLPPNFRVIKTFPRKPYFNYQPSFNSYGMNQQWELLAFGNNASPTTEGENNITV